MRQEPLEIRLSHLVRKQPTRETRVVLFLLREYGELDYPFPLSLSPRVWKVPNPVAIVMTSMMTSERNYTRYRLQLEIRQRILDRTNP